MNHLRALRCVTLTLSVALIFAAQVAAQEGSQQKGQISYEIIDLGTLGGTMGFGTGINNKGWVEGVSSIASDSSFHAFLWRDGVMNDLGTLGGPNSGSVGVLAQWGPNERGQVASYSDTPFPEPFGNDLCFYGTNLICHAFLWQDGVMTDLGTLGGNNSLADAINNRGQVTGFAENNVPDPTCQPPQVFQIKPVMWEKGTISELPTLPGDTDGWAAGINDRGQAVGATGDCHTSPGGYGAMFRHAVTWDKGEVKHLGSLGGKLFHFAISINNNGQITGYSDPPGDVAPHAFLWEDGVMTDLGTLPGDIGSSAIHINNKSQIVGVSVDANSNFTAFLWERGRMTDLNSLIDPESPLYLMWANYINVRGEIAGWGFHIPTGELHAYLARPKHGSGKQEAALLGKAENKSVQKFKLPNHISELLRRSQPLTVFGAVPR